MTCFEKVSLSQWLKDYRDDGEDAYNMIKIPHRATGGSAGYDFYAPFDFSLMPGESIKIPTGIRAVMESNFFLMIVPRSSLGFKYGIYLANTCGIIDSDYIEAENEGHIFIKIVNGGPDVISIMRGDGIAQGIILPYIKTDEDDSNAARVGGIGSTDNN